MSKIGFFVGCMAAVSLTMSSAAYAGTATRSAQALPKLVVSKDAVRDGSKMKRKASLLQVSDMQTYQKSGAATQGKITGAGSGIGALAKWAWYSVVFAGVTWVVWSNVDSKQQIIISAAA